MRSPLRTNGRVISILNKIIADLFNSSVGDERQRRHRRRENGSLVDVTEDVSDVGVIKVRVPRVR